MEIADILEDRNNRAILERWRDLSLPDGWLVAGCQFQTVWNLRSGLAPEAEVRLVPEVNPRLAPLVPHRDLFHEKAASYRARWAWLQIPPDHHQRDAPLTAPAGCSRP